MPIARLCLFALEHTELFNAMLNMLFQGLWPTIMTKQATTIRHSDVVDSECKDALVHQAGTSLSLPTGSPQARRIPV